MWTIWDTKNRLSGEREREEKTPRYIDHATIFLVSWCKLVCSLSLFLSTYVFCLVASMFVLVASCSFWTDSIHVRVHIHFGKIPKVIQFDIECAAYVQHSFNIDIQLESVQVDIVKSHSDFTNQNGQNDSVRYIYIFSWIMFKCLHSEMSVRLVWFENMLANYEYGFMTVNFQSTHFENKLLLYRWMQNVNAMLVSKSTCWTNNERV